MFSFHRPKVYRSSTGCCICKAKSSSSRFTDSKKYEQDFLECFKLSAPRQGEICNACVLLVKRWKKLPAGSERNWQHVVDARAGPGMKSMTKFKKKNGESIDKNKKKKHFDREYSPVLSDKSDPPEDMELVEDFLSEDGPSGRSSCTASPGSSDYEENVDKKHKIKENQNPFINDFLDMDYWKQETICCGIIFRGLNNEVLTDPRLLKPCGNRKTQFEGHINKGRKDISEHSLTKIYSDSSSDSGYDESSNQGTLPDTAFKKEISIEEINRQNSNPN